MAISGLNQGSLLKRTLLHVVAFVVGTLAFVGLVSFVSVSVVRGLLPSRGDGARGGIEADLGAPKGDAAGKVAAPAGKPRAGALPVARTTQGKDG